MLRHRNVGGGNEVMGEGIFIGDVEEPVRSSKLKNSEQSEGGCWKYLSLLMIVCTVLSLCLNAFQFKLIDGYLRDIQELNDTHHNLHSEWEADRHSVEECKAEMNNMETHMNNRETEKSKLEQEVTRLRRAIQKGGVTEDPHPDHEDHHAGDTPPTPHPEQNYPTRPNHQQLEEQQRQQLDEQRQEEEQRKQQEELQREEETQRQQEEQQRQLEEQHRQEQMKVEAQQHQEG
eukprot:GFUD01085879.1.p1 GENE.GFUD01085879.1~~GFUD01085879.1.p1  ORF type:complete len:232 (+),score=73.55 GFUD01085879.1:52-747(+)